MNIDNWLHISANHWIIIVVCILFIIFAIDIIQLISSRFSSKLSNDEQEQLKEISHLRRKNKFGKPPNL